MNEPVARLRIELENVRPTIWRRVDVPLTCTLLALHRIIQIAFGWTDSHLFRFTVGDRDYGIPFDDDEDLDLKFYRAGGLRLRTLVSRGVQRFPYEYDFGDSWRHEVAVERVFDGEPETDYPAFVDGKRRGPPEDVGGAEGFMAFLEAALIPTHEEHRDMIRWYGRRYDPADIGEAFIRLRLRDLALRRRGAVRHNQAQPPGPATPPG